MIKCDRCEKLTDERFVAIHKECENCGISINVEIYQFVGTEEEAKSYGGPWTSTPKVGGFYTGSTTAFCPSDTSVKILSEVYPNHWKLLTQEEKDDDYDWDEEDDIWTAVGKYRKAHPEEKKLSAFDLLRKAKKVIYSMKLSIGAHPDHQPDSEFWDMTDTAQEMEDEIEKFLNKS